MRPIRQEPDTGALSVTGEARRRTGAVRTRRADRHVRRDCPRQHHGERSGVEPGDRGGHADGGPDGDLSLRGGRLAARRRSAHRHRGRRRQDLRAGSLASACRASTSARSTVRGSTASGSISPSPACHRALATRCGSSGTTRSPTPTPSVCRCRSTGHRANVGARHRRRHHRALRVPQSWQRRAGGVPRLRRLRAYLASGRRRLLCGALYAERLRLHRRPRAIGLGTGEYNIVPIAHSTVTGTYNNLATERVILQ